MVLNSASIEIIQPAKITLPSNTNSLLLINNGLGYPLGKFKNRVQEGLFRLDTATTQLLVSEASAIIKESPRFENVDYIDDIYFRRIQNQLQPIEWNAVHSLCSQYNADALLSLEAFGIKDTIIETSYYDGYVYHTYSNLTLLVNVMWRIYLSNSNTVLEKYIQKDTIYIEEISSKNEYFNAITTTYAINFLSNKIVSRLAVDIADRVAPYWLPIERDFYIYTANKQMKQAARFVYDNDWHKAAKIWRLLVDNENDRVAAAACHNMALACEVDGKLDVAVVWLNKSLKINFTDISNNYLKQIKLRIAEADILDKQFGVSE
jgi:hypothetical protein